jgi:hypothetical protein
LGGSITIVEIGGGRVQRTNAGGGSNIHRCSGSLVMNVVANTLKAPKIQKKFLETLWNMRKPNKVFKALDKII